MANFYEKLKLDNFASIEEVKASFMKLSRYYHPDRNNDPDAERIFIEINKAYEVLGKPKTKEQYDYALRNGYEDNYERDGFVDDLNIDPDKATTLFLKKLEKALDDIDEIRLMLEIWPPTAKKNQMLKVCDEFEVTFPLILKKMVLDGPSGVDENIAIFNKRISDLGVFYIMCKVLTQEHEKIAKEKKQKEAKLKREKAKLKREEELAEHKELLKKAAKLKIDKADKLKLKELREAIAKAEALKTNKKLSSDIRKILKVIESTFDLINSVEWDEALSDYKTACETNKKYFEDKLKSLKDSDKLLSNSVMGNIKEKIESIESLAEEVKGDIEQVLADPRYFIKQRRKKKIRSMFSL